MTGWIALLDANVLYPAPLRDLFVQLAFDGLFQGKWTEKIHDEWIDALMRRQPDRDRNVLEKTRQAMNSAVRDCLIEELASVFARNLTGEDYFTHAFAVPVNEALWNFVMRRAPPSCCAPPVMLRVVAASRKRQQNGLIPASLDSATGARNDPVEDPALCHASPVMLRAPPVMLRVVAASRKSQQNDRVGGASRPRPLTPPYKRSSHTAVPVKQTIDHRSIKTRAP